MKTLNIGADCLDKFCYYCCDNEDWSRFSPSKMSSTTGKSFNDAGFSSTGGSSSLMLPTIPCLEPSSPVPLLGKMPLLEAWKSDCSFCRDSKFAARLTSSGLIEEPGADYTESRCIFCWICKIDWLYWARDPPTFYSSAKRGSKLTSILPGSWMNDP